ncbi:MAG TPA: chorismate mutase [Acidisphaera sp.]|nr:chorismate mutase [Acidisphaera sp.]
MPKDDQFSPPPDLAALRAEVDAVDDAIHDALRRRADVVARIAASGAKSGVALRPGREAAILRRLIARHDGPLPAQALVRVWRELLAATTAMQGPVLIAVCDPDPAGAVTHLAREHFGALTPIRVHRSPAQAMTEVRHGSATVAVLKLPAEDESAQEAWWPALRQTDEKRVHVVARLPFWAPRPDGAPPAAALVISASAPDPSGRDRTLIAIELDGEASRARLVGALTAAGLEVADVLLRRSPGGGVAQALVEVDGFVTDEDARLGQLAPPLRSPVVIGAYALPEGAAA